MSRSHCYMISCSTWRNRGRSMFGFFLMLKYFPPVLYTMHGFNEDIAGKQPPHHPPRNCQNHRLGPRAPRQPLAHPPHPRLLVVSLHPANAKTPPLLPHGTRLLRPPRRPPLLPPPQSRHVQCQSAGADGSARTRVLRRDAQTGEEGDCLDG